MKNVLLTIAYDGTEFCGWQRQPNQRSVQSEIEKALSIVCAQPIRINGTSRTDAGVHAYGQRASFQAEFSIPTERIPLAVNGILAGAAADGRPVSADAAILTAEEVPAEFHARFDAIGKKYIYQINNSRKPDPFLRNYSWQIYGDLDLEAMKASAAHLVGTMDFKSFQAAGGKEMESTVRTIYSARFTRSENGMIVFEVIGDGFLYNMVRIISGTLIDIGLGRKNTHGIREIIESKDRQTAGQTAPPHGLYLAEVYFDKEKIYGQT